eukprot:Pgem_evm1s4842
MVYICGSTYTLVDDEEKWKDDINAISRFNRDLEIYKLLSRVWSLLVPGKLNLKSSVLRRRVNWYSRKNKKNHSPRLKN